jgi:polyisoprenoid-binding protein YceI
MTTTRDHAVRTPALGRYQIDPGRSAVTFTTRHLFGLARVRGTLAVTGGTIDVAEPLAQSGIEAVVDAASFRTGSGQRDSAVRSASFLDTGRFPALVFRAGAAPDSPAPSGPPAAAGPAGPGRLTVPGSLTVRDVTRPVILAAEFTGIEPRSFAVRATTRIDRTEFGVTAARGLAARYLDITVEAQCVRS